MTAEEELRQEIGYLKRQLAKTLDCIAILQAGRAVVPSSLRQSVKNYEQRLREAELELLQTKLVASQTPSKIAGHIGPDILLVAPGNRPDHARQAQRPPTEEGETDVQSV